MKNKKALLIVTIFVVVIAMIGGTYAYWDWETTEDKWVSIETTIPDICSVSVDGGVDADSASIAMMPSSCTNTSNAIIKPIRIDVEFNKSDEPAFVDLWLDINEIAPELANTENFRYAITDSNTSCVDGVLYSGNFKGLVSGNKVRVFTKTYTPPPSSYSEIYYLYIWLDAAETSLDTAGKSFQLSLNGDCSNYVDETPPGITIDSTNNVASTQTVTLSMTDDEEIMSYYFGKTNPNESSVTWNTVNTQEELTETVVVDSAGTWYFAVKDDAENITVVDKDFYQTTLQATNGTVSPTTVITMEGNSFTLPTPTVTESNYSFYGWYENSDFSGDTLTTYTPSSSKTLYAQISLSTYTITYYLGNGSSTAGASSIGTTTCAYDSTCTLTTWADLSATFPNSSNGWSFAGWSANASGTSADYTDGTTISSANGDDISLYALGSRTFNFYSGQAPTSTLDTQTQYWNPYSTDTSYLTSITVPAATEIEGWTYLGYRATNDASSTTTFTTTGSTTPAADFLTSFNFRTIYSRTVTISYNANGGTGTTASTTGTQYYNSGYAIDGSNSGANVSSVSITLASNGFSRTGYSFSKWAAGSASGTQYAAGGSYSFSNGVTASASATMYAVWSANKYTVSFNANGGSTTTTNKAVKYASTYGTLPTPTRAGYTFGAWYDVISRGNQSWTAASGSNYSYISVVNNVYPNVTYTISMNSAVVSPTTDTYFTTLIYDFTDSKSIASTTTNFSSSSISYKITSPSTTNISHDVRLLIYAGPSGSTGGNTVTFSNVKIGTTGTTSATTFTSTTKVSATANHTLFASWTDNIKPTASLTATGSSSGSITGTLSSIVEEGSGVSKYYYAKSTSSTCPSSGYTESDNTSFTFTNLSAGTYYVCAYIKDKAGNQSTTYKASATVTLPLSDKLSGVTNMSTSLTGGMYRFQGLYEDVTNNYVCFGTTTKSTCTGTPGTYMYRIIGYNSSGQVKLIKHEPLSTLYAWNSSASFSLWSDSSLYSGLNGSYFLSNTTYVPSTTWSNKIVSSTWYEYTWNVGNGNGVNMTGPNLYLFERGEHSSYTDLDIATMTGKIGLMKGSDYYLSKSNSAICSQTPSYTNNCIDSWMQMSNYYAYNTLTSTSGQYYEWTMDTFQYVSSSYYAYGVRLDDYGGYYSTNYGSYTNTRYVRPVFYLASSVNFVSGSGTLADPYIIS